MNESNAPQEQVRIVQETVAGKEITLAHIIGGPAPIVYAVSYTHLDVYKRQEPFLFGTAPAFSYWFSTHRAAFIFSPWSPPHPSAKR